MNILMLLTLLVGTNYRAEDFHYYETNLQSRGLPLVNKVYVEVPEKDKKAFFEFIEKTKVERFKEFQNNDLAGILLFTENKTATLDVLNKLNAKKYKAYPVIIFDGIECTSNGEIVVRVQPSVNHEDFTKRLNSIADGKFSVRKIGPRLYTVTVEDLSNPSNIIILANLLAKDTVWNQSVIVNWFPLDGYVKANASVETGAIGQLGEMRSFNVTLDVFNRDIKIRTDMLPQLGQGLLPFPYAGEIWFDPQPPVITEVNTSRGKTVTINYPFRQLQYGNFVFQPIVISYEKNGELKTIKTTPCQYMVRSVIQGTEIEDIQARSGDGLGLPALPVDELKPDDKLKVYQYIKIGTSGLCFGLAAIFIVGALVGFKRSFTNWLYEPNEQDRLWKGLEWCNGAPDSAYYEVVAAYVHKLLNTYGTSLFAVDLSECTDNFNNLVNELNKLYQPDPLWNRESLKDFVKKVCKDRCYK